MFVCFELSSLTCLLVKGKESDPWKGQSDGEMSAGSCRVQRDKGQLRVSIPNFHGLISHWVNYINRWFIIPHQLNPSLSLHNFASA